MDKKELVRKAFNTLRLNGVVRTQKDLANLLDMDTATLSRALNGDPRYLTDKFVSRIMSIGDEPTSTSIPAEWVREFPALDPVGYEMPASTDPSIKIIPIEAAAGTLGEFVDSVQQRDCEKMLSPIKGADFAIKVSGDSMTPVYPSGSIVLIKKVNENAFIEWGKVYVLDTANGPVIKKVMNTAERNVIECISLNESYPPFTIDTSYIFGWYRVLMVMSTQ